MVHVPSPTSRYGYYSFSTRSVWEWKPKGYPSWTNTFVSNPVYAYSNRPTPVVGSPPLATNYHRKVAFLTSLSGVDVTTNSHEVKGPSSIHNNGLALYGSPHGSAYASANVVAPGWMTDQCIQGCMTALVDMRANILEDLGQALQTVSMMGDIFKLIVDLFLIAWKGDWKRLRSALKASGSYSKTASSGWLMYYYGIMPLVSTMVALSNEYAPKRKLKTIVRKASDSVDPLGFVANPTANQIVASGKAEIGVKVGMTVAIDLTADMSMTNALGLSQDSHVFTDLVLTAWALTPYSFVVDWILPIERFLATRSWRSGLDYQSGYIDKRLTCDAMYVVLNPMTGANDGGMLPRGQVKALQLQRIAYNTFSPPSGLSFKQSLSPTQILNAIALSLQRM